MTCSKVFVTNLWINFPIHSSEILFKIPPLVGIIRDRFFLNLKNPINWSIVPLVLSDRKCFV